MRFCCPVCRGELDEMCRPCPEMSAVRTGMPSAFSPMKMLWSIQMSSPASVTIISGKRLKALGMSLPAALSDCGCVVN